MSGWEFPLRRCVCEGGVSVCIHAELWDKAKALCPQACVFMAILSI